MRDAKMSAIERFYSDCRLGVSKFANLAEGLGEILLAQEFKVPIAGEIFEEPLVFAHFSSRSASADFRQIVLGYVREEDRCYQTPTITNSNGAIVVPKLGYFTTGICSENLSLLWNRENGSFAVELNNERVPFNFIDNRYLAGTNIRIAVHHHYLTERLYGDDRQAELEIAPELTARNHRALASGAEIIRAVYPDYWDLTNVCTKEVVLFRNPHKNSFATLASYGSCFINVLEEPASSVFFVEDIVHQCGHLALSAIAFEPQRFLAVDPTTPLGKYTSLSAEHRNVFTAFHGLFTEAVIAKALDQCLTKSAFNQTETYECIGRLAFVMAKLENDLKNMNVPSFYSEEGASFFQCTADIFADIHSRRALALQSVDICNQSYNFSAEKFFQQNSGR
jgi:hypothetical protein